ncbi:MAG: hypothetical protein DMD30_03610 [Gemmatimonadetes bacterium]|nr:MAG: hypothetical protein DMD30_03610 [Gemmatimonadota bacterium]PYP53999.1 MAG: hypothetical protein DMD39_03055 [Gemmatimonadota bacterium]
MSALLKRSFLLAAGPLLTLVSACESQRPKYEGPYAAEVAEAVPMIEKAVGLKYKTPPKVETRSNEQVREFVIKQLTDSLATHDIDGQEAAYKRLGMIPDTLKLKPFLTSLLEEQIVGYYDPHTKVLYVVDGAPKDMASMTITHELVHALQDQYISLDSVQKIRDDNDRLSAAQSVFEGQAVYEQISIMLGGSNIAINLPGGWDRIREMIRENQASMPIFAAAPKVIQETLIFPYLSGAEFYRNYKERKSGSIIYKDMPVSTEQIIHPAAFFGTRDNPTRVTLGTLANATKVYENDLGEFETRLFLYQQLNDQNEAVRGASGWDGDRYAVVNTPQGQGIVWLTVWDSPVEGGEFFHLAGQAVEARYSTKVASGSTELVKKYSGGGRTIQISTMEIQGRPVVIYADVPAGANPNIINPAQVTLSQ